MAERRRPGRSRGARTANGKSAKANGGDDRAAFARRPENIGKVDVSRPQNGDEYLESLRDGRDVFIYGERVKDVTTHPAFRNTARMVARLTTRCMTPSARTSCCCRPTPATAA